MEATIMATYGPGVKADDAPVIAAEHAEEYAKDLIGRTLAENGSTEQKFTIIDAFVRTDQYRADRGYVIALYQER